MPPVTLTDPLITYQSLWCFLNPAQCWDLSHPNKELEFDIPPIPVPPDALTHATTGFAINALLESVGYIGPDQEGGPDPNGPWGPVIRDILVGLSVIQLASRVSDADHATEIRTAAARVIHEQAERLARDVTSTVTA